MFSFRDSDLEIEGFNLCEVINMVPKILSVNIKNPVGNNVTVTVPVH